MRMNLAEQLPVLAFVHQIIDAVVQKENDVEAGRPLERETPSIRAHRFPHAPPCLEAHRKRQIGRDIRKPGHSKPIPQRARTGPDFKNRRPRRSAITLDDFFNENMPTVVADMRHESVVERGKSAVVHGRYNLMSTYISRRHFRTMSRSFFCAMISRVLSASSS